MEQVIEKFNQIAISHLENLTGLQEKKSIKPISCTRDMDTNKVLMISVNRELPHQLKNHFWLLDKKSDMIDLSKSEDLDKLKNFFDGLERVARITTLSVPRELGNLSKALKSLPMLTDSISSPDKQKQQEPQEQPKPPQTTRSP